MIVQHRLRQTHFTIVRRIKYVYFLNVKVVLVFTLAQWKGSALVSGTEPAFLISSVLTYDFIPTQLPWGNMNFVCLGMAIK